MSELVSSVAHFIPTLGYRQLRSQREMAQPVGVHSLPPTKFKPCLPSNSHGPQGGARTRTRTQTTVDSLAGRQTALPAPIPSGQVKEPSATSESSTPTATEAGRPPSASDASRWREETCGDTSPELGIVSW